MNEITLGAAMVAEAASHLEFVGDNGDGTTVWRDRRNNAHFRLDHRHVIQHSLTDRMRDGLAREGTFEPQEDTPEATVVAPNTSAPIQGAESVGGHGAGWRWAKIRSTHPCPMDTDGDGDCGHCLRGRGISDCVGGRIVNVEWAIDNKPAIEEWAAGDRLDPAPEFQRVVLSDEILQVIAHS